MFSESINKGGSIELICGSMFSGKTEELIRRLKRAKFAKQKIEIFKPKIDTRYAIEQVVSHDLQSVECKAISNAEEMLQCAEDVQVVGVDEAQFFGDNLSEVLCKLAERGKRVIVAGLDMDYKGNAFGPMPKVMAVAEDVLKVHAICVRCGNLANYSHRLSLSEELVLLGEKEAYEPLCRACYNRAIKIDKE